jgi:hypothetical protein
VNHCGRIIRLPMIYTGDSCCRVELPLREQLEEPVIHSYLAYSAAL